MRLALLDRGQDVPTRATFSLMRLIGRTEVPEVIRVLSYRHRYFGTPHNALTQAALRGPSAWTVGERELFAAFTSSRNQCQFCTTAHQAFAASSEGDEVVAAAIASPDTAPVGPKIAAVLAFLARMADEPDHLGPDDVRRVRDAGVADDALEEAVYISALFHLINRVVDAFGAGPLEGRGLEVARRIVMGGGYKLPPTIRYLSRSRLAT